jgi:hypothetical protein
MGKTELVRAEADLREALGDWMTRGTVTVNGSTKRSAFYVYSPCRAWTQTCSRIHREVRQVPIAHEVRELRDDVHLLRRGATVLFRFAPARPYYNMRNPQLAAYERDAVQGLMYARRDLKLSAKDLAPCTTQYFPQDRLVSRTKRSAKFRDAGDGPVHVTAKRLRMAGFKAKDLAEAYSREELLEAGFAGATVKKAFKR